MGGIRRNVPLCYVAHLQTRSCPSSQTSTLKKFYIFFYQRKRNYYCYQNNLSFARRISIIRSVHLCTTKLNLTTNSNMHCITNKYTLLAQQFYCFCEKQKRTAGYIGCACFVLSYFDSQDRKKIIFVIINAKFTAVDLAN